MSVSLMLDNSGNLQVGTEIKTVAGREALIQDVRTRLRLFQGEFHFDIESGLPYIELLQNNNRQTFENEVLNEVLKDSRVKTAKITNSELINGKLNLEIEITTKEGYTLTV